MGGAVTSDGYDPVMPDPSGESAAVAIGRAIELAGLTPDDIDLVTADAAGTLPGDLAEATALHLALGQRRPAVYAPKSALGHSWGASGAVDAVLTVQALRDQVVPPTLNLTHLDPGVDLDVVAGAPRPRRLPLRRRRLLRVRRAQRGAGVRGGLAAQTLSRPNR